MRFSLSEKASGISFYAFALISIASIFFGIAIDETLPFLIPFAWLFVWLVLFDFRKIYFLLITLIPFTKEFGLGSFALDIPAEPVLIILLVVFMFHLLDKRAYDPAFLRHPLMTILFLHLFWLLVTVFFSYKVLISTKFFLAKIWYVTTFIFLTGLFVRKLRDFKILFWCVLIPSVVTIIAVLLNHSESGFSFEEINAASSVFYRNHVNYAAFISLLMPFIWLAATWYQPATLPRHFLNFCKLLFLVAIYFAFARGAWIAIFAAVAFYYGLKFRLLKFMFIPALALFVWLGYYLTHENKYLDFAPEFGKAIYHGNIIDHMKATIRNQDLSTAERFYRWVAAVRMSDEHPLTGFGPGSFYYFYQPYTVTEFTTYVSDNPEKSGVHNYFLMTAVEQGWVGLALFLLLTCGIFYFGVKSYHRTHNRDDKNLIAAVLCSLVIIYVQLTLSDLVEEIKIGGFFFINIALLVNWADEKREPAAKT
ncbi:MAG TPA: O-antigen ligase family protein [Chitinophagales bacterium]|nr:O-antigen ligase family protein [Chitinophagales bacterium]